MEVGFIERGSLFKKEQTKKKKIRGRTRYNLMSLRGGQRGAKGELIAFQYMYHIHKTH